MPIEINGVKYYRTKEACDMVGIAKNTYLRWVTSGNFCDVHFRDRRGWRLFTSDEIDMLRTEVNKIQNNAGGRS